VGFNGLNYCGFNANHIDIASNFSGTLMGITNMVANFMGFLAPMAVSAIVEGHVSQVLLHVWLGLVN
jgi:MFS transporter, ACS family, solute carrier family 17 (sodium-dependent inorganic phosphate cotransporter), member 5